MIVKTKEVYDDGQIHRIFNFKIDKSVPSLMQKTAFRQQVFRKAMRLRKSFCKIINERSRNIGILEDVIIGRQSLRSSLTNVGPIRANDRTEWSKALQNSLRAQGTVYNVRVRSLYNVFNMEANSKN